MIHQIKSSSILAAITVFALVASSIKAQDYDNDAETAISGLSGLSGLGGLAGLGSGVMTGYAPIGSASDGISQADRNAAAESSDVESGDYDEDSNDSAASEEHPILSKFFNLISGRSKRSVQQSDALDVAQTQVRHRVKRSHHKGYVPYVSTYVKTDKKANFKWGVKAKVGKKYGRK